MDTQSTAPTVLIIDDDEISNYITSRTIKKANPDATVITMLNGMEAINYFKNISKEAPDFVFLDINMPLMNGFEFLSWFSNSIFKGKTKIIMYSASIRFEEKGHANKFDNVVAYIEKPLSHKQIDSLLQLV